MLGWHLGFALGGVYGWVLYFETPLTFLGALSWTVFTWLNLIFLVTDNSDAATLGTPSNVSYPYHIPLAKSAYCNLYQGLYPWMRGGSGCVRPNCAIPRTMVKDERRFRFSCRIHISVLWDSSISRFLGGMHFHLANSHRMRSGYWSARRLEPRVISRRWPSNTSVFVSIANAVVLSESAKKSVIFS